MIIIDPDTGNEETVRGGGLCTLIKSELACDNMKLAHLNACNSFIEIQWLVIKPDHMKTIVLGNVYRPPAGSVNDFLDHLSSNLSEVNSLPDWEIHLMGDFNINTLTKTPGLRNLKDITRQAGLRQLINLPTRITQKTSTLIDHYYTNCAHIHAAGCVPLNISDHNLIFLSKKKKPILKKKIKFSGTYI